jgi:hypothetical protein
VVIKQKQVFLFAGIGLAVSGIATILLIYQGMTATDASDFARVTDQQSGEFQLEEVHANPNLVMHIHTQLELHNEGQQVQVPAEIGIASELWHDHSLDQFGPSRALLAPLHTHDTTGTIHIESVVLRNYTLGEFLSIWGFDQERIVKVSTGDGLDIADYSNHVLGRNARIIMEVRD